MITDDMLPKLPAPLSYGPGGTVPYAYTAAQVRAVQREAYATAIKAAQADLLKLQIFAAAVLNMAEEFIGDVDGYALQGIAEECGLIAETQVDQSCCESCACAEAGLDFPTDCYRITETMKRAIQAAREDTEKESE